MAMVVLLVAEIPAHFVEADLLQLILPFAEVAQISIQRVWPRRAYVKLTSVKEAMKAIVGLKGRQLGPDTVLR